MDEHFYTIEYLEYEIDREKKQLKYSREALELEERKYTAKQMRAYYATKGWKRKPRKSTKRRKGRKR